MGYSTIVKFFFNISLGNPLLDRLRTNENTKPENLFLGLVYSTDFIFKCWKAPGGPYKTQFPDQALNDNTGYWVWINTDKMVTVP